MVYRFTILFTEHSFSEFHKGKQKYELLNTAKSVSIPLLVSDLLLTVRPVNKNISANNHRYSRP